MRRFLIVTQHLLTALQSGVRKENPLAHHSKDGYGIVERSKAVWFIIAPLTRRSEVLYNVDSWTAGVLMYEHQVKPEVVLQRLGAYGLQKGQDPAKILKSDWLAST